MRLSPLVACFLFISWSEHLCAEQLPEMRPALIGTGSRSWINLINTERLMKKGQKDAMVMFTCGVADLGDCFGIVFYRGTPGCEPLAHEALEEVKRAYFVPAVYNYQKRNALLHGTIVYRVVGGQPRLRIYLNQEKEHLLHGDDFISPQPVFVPGTKFRGLRYPNEGIGRAANVVVRLTVDATGELKGSQVIFETPPGKGFGAEFVSGIKDMTFLPGYLHGEPVACSANWEIIASGAGRGEQWKPD
jgi:hypothetical protein